MNPSTEKENVSAFMVHHVLNKNKKRKRKDGKNVSNVPTELTKIKKKKHKKTKFQESKLVKKSLQPFTKPKIYPNETEQPFAKLKLHLNGSGSPKRQKLAQKQKLPSSTKTQTQPISSPKKSLSLSSVKSDSSCLSFENYFNNKRLLEWLIYPINVDDFMKNNWEKEPFHVSRKHSEFSVLLNTPMIDDLLRSNNISYTKNIDITCYSDGVKELLNPEGLARPHVVWDFYCNKCSIRLLNPQTFVPNIHRFTSELQEYFGCFVGCNAYLTPPHSQGFAPHYDDIEAFILQIEGKKLWKVYKPRSDSEFLPRYSSRDFNQAEIGEPLLEVLLEEGDVLYLPRGFIHQACTQDASHSLHITVSVYQRNAWIDLLEKAIPEALDKAWKNDIEFRKGLPLDYLKANGLAKNDQYKETRTFIKSNLMSLICKLADYVQIDSAVDQLGIKFLYDALPPALTEEEKQCTVYGSGLKMVKGGNVSGQDTFVFTEDVEVALLRGYVSRFVKHIEQVDADKQKITYRLYYTTDNSLEYHAEQTSFLLIPKYLVKCVQLLFQSFPNYVPIAELPCENIENKINLVADMWERGIVRTKNPML